MQVSTWVDVWFVHLDGDGMQDAADDSLSDDERARACRFVQPRDAHRYRAAHGWLRSVLGRYLGVPAADVRMTDGAGKPRLAPRPGQPVLEFNLTHAGGWAACAISPDVPVGIDLERERPLEDLGTMAASIFSPEDQQRFAALPSRDRLVAFFRAWTRKEACLKATGHGLGLAPERVSVTFAPADAPRVLSYDGRACEREWTLAAIDVPPGWAAALAVPASSVAVHTAAGMTCARAGAAHGSVTPGPFCS